jgi:hypothetical protein
MKTINKMSKKRAYCTPDILCIKMDNEISLVLSSDTNPDGDPTFSSTPEYFNNNPFKSNLG